MPIDLNDDELVTRLETLEGQRDTLLTQRLPLNLPPLGLHMGDEMPPAGTLDGQILRVAALLFRLQVEYVKRELNRPGIGGLPHVAAILRAGLYDEEPDEELDQEWKEIQTMERPLSESRPENRPENPFYPGLVRDVPGASVDECKSHIMGYLACLQADGLGLEALDRLQTLSPQMREALDALVQENELSVLRRGGVQRVGFSEDVFLYRAMGLAEDPIPQTLSEPGTLRMVCLLCGREIHGTPIAEAGGKVAPVLTGEAVPILTYRNERASSTGFAHTACTGGPDVHTHDLTGKPDYAGYNEDATEPAYSDGRRVVGELPTAFDGDPKL